MCIQVQVPESVLCKFLQVKDAVKDNVCKLHERDRALQDLMHKTGTASVMNGSTQFYSATLTAGIHCYEVSLSDISVLNSICCVL